MISFFVEGLVQDNLLFAEGLVQDDAVNQFDMAPVLGIVDTGIGMDDETYSKPPLSPIRHLGNRLTFLNGLFNDLECMVIWGDKDNESHDDEEEQQFPPQINPGEERDITLLFGVGSISRMVERLERCSGAGVLLLVHC